MQNIFESIRYDFVTLNCPGKVAFRTLRVCGTCIIAKEVNCKSFEIIGFTCLWNVDIENVRWNDTQKRTENTGSGFSLCNINKRKVITQVFLLSGDSIWLMEQSSTCSSSIGWRVGNTIALLYNLPNNNISYPHAKNTQQEGTFAFMPLRNEDGPFLGEMSSGINSIR